VKKIICLIVCLLFIVDCAVFASEEASENEKGNVLAGIVRAPIDIIFAPIEGGGLVDLVMKPVEVLLSPLSELGEVVVTPGRTKEYTYNINKNISVITEEEILNSHANNVQELIASQTNIVESGFLGNAKDSQIDIRGYGETGPLNYLVLIDGRRINQIDLSGADLSQLDIGSIERIEISRGPGSVLYGDNATGGVINIITKKGLEGYHISYTQSFSSYQGHKEHLTMSGEHDFLNYFSSISYQESEGYRVNNNYEASDVFSKLLITPIDAFGVEFTFSHHKDVYGQPGALYDANLESDSREGSRFPNSRARTEDYYFTVNPMLYGELWGQEGVLSSFFSYRSRRTKSIDIGFSDYETNHHIVSFDFRPKCELNLSFWDDKLENKLIFGVDYFTAKDEILSGDVTLTKSQLDVIKETFGVYCSNIMMIGKRFIFNVGIRGEWAEYVFDQFEPAASKDDQSLREAAFDAGLGYKYNERSQIYSNFARSFRLPATDEYFASAYEWAWGPFTFTQAANLNVELKHQVGNTFEIGIKDNSFDKVHLNMDYYYTDNKNEIYYDPKDFVNTNYHNVIHQGIECEIEAEFYDIVKLRGNYTFQRSFYKGGKYDQNELPLVPEHKIFFGCDIEPVESLIFTLGFNYIGERPVASDPKNDSSPLEFCTFIDIGVSYRWKNVKIFGKINNLFDRDYYSNATRNFLGHTAFYPSEGRNYICGMSLEF
jgi:iron complex outermembrane recepter protein